MYFFIARIFFCASWYISRDSNARRSESQINSVQGGCGGVSGFNFWTRALRSCFRNVWARIVIRPQYEAARDLVMLPADLQQFLFYVACNASYLFYNLSNKKISVEYNILHFLIKICLTIPSACKWLTISKVYPYISQIYKIYYEDLRTDLLSRTTPFHRHYR